MNRPAILLDEADAPQCEHAVQFDAGELRGKTEITRDGFLKTTAYVARTGVQVYRRDDGSEFKQLRHPDDVFAAASLETLKMAPFVDSHPDTPTLLITATDARKYQRGSVGENVRPDGRFVLAPICVTDGETIQAIQNGKRQLSCGYSADLEMSPGIYDGVDYDARQRNIRYNHVALTDVARGGPHLRIPDSADAPHVAIADDLSQLWRQAAPREEIPMNTPTLTPVMLDGITYQASPEVARALDRAIAEIGTLKTNVADGVKALETEKGRADGLADKVKELEARDVAKAINDGVTRRLALIGDVRSRRNADGTPLVDSAAKLEELDELGIMRAVVKARHPEAVLDGKSEDYVRGRYETVIESAAKPTADAGSDAIGAQRQAAVPVADASTGDAIAAARQRMAERNRNAWKPTKAA